MENTNVDSTPLPTNAYARPSDRFVTVVYRSDYNGKWRTCLRVDGVYVLSTDKAHASEHLARTIATLDTGIDNGRGAEVADKAERDWVKAAPLRPKAEGK